MFVKPLLWRSTLCKHIQIDINAHKDANMNWFTFGNQGVLYNVLLHISAYLVMQYLRKNILIAAANIHLHFA